VKGIVLAGGYIGAAQLEKLARPLASGAYGQCLLRVVAEPRAQ
jgi:hypothetical protein